MKFLLKNMALTVFVSALNVTVGQSAEFPNLIIAGGKNVLYKNTIPKLASYRVYAKIPEGSSATDVVYRIYPKGNSANNIRCYSTDVVYPCFKISVNQALNQGKIVQLITKTKSAWTFTEEGFIQVSSVRVPETQLLGLAPMVFEPVTLTGIESTPPFPDQYIVVFKNDSNLSSGSDDNAIADKVRTFGAGYGAEVKDVFSQKVLKGFSGRIPPGLLKKLHDDPNVDYIENVIRTSISAVASWGLDSIDGTKDDNYSPPTIAGANGAGVHVYVLDTGIRNNHPEFTGRVSSSGSNSNQVKDTIGLNDCNGHGSHVAGIIGGNTVGVANGVTLHSVRIVDCYGNGDSIAFVNGLSWVANNAIRPAVVNISVGSDNSNAINSSVATLVDSGIPVVVSAGNSTADACLNSPSSAIKAISVAASDSNNNIASFSNTGTCVDIIAPGDGITSVNYTGGLMDRSGTSQAAPYVTGIIASYLGRDPTLTSSALRNKLISDTIQNVVGGTLLKGTPNRFARIQ